MHYRQERRFASATAAIDRSPPSALLPDPSLSTHSSTKRLKRTNLERTNGPFKIVGLDCNE